MSSFVIEINYTPDESLDTLERIAGFNQDLLDKTYWGDMLDEPKGWAVVEAGSENEARDMLPPNLRDSATIAQVEKISANQVYQMHQKAA